MDDDDWLDSSDHVDENAAQQRLMQNERDQISQREQNQGYLDGLEWADHNYVKVKQDTAGMEYVAEAFDSGIA